MCLFVYMLCSHMVKDGTIILGEVCEHEEERYEEGMTKLYFNYIKNNKIMEILRSRGMEESY